VFWPIAHLLNDAYGWRTPLVIFAALNLLLYAPLDWIGLARGESPPQAQQAPAAATATVPGRPPLEGRARTLAMLLFGTIVAASAIVFGAMAAHLVPLLEASGLASATAVWIASLKGVAQVAGRIWDLTLARKWHPIDLGRVSVAIIARRSSH
jgi:predicted MFS family arabinose efflux permease